jgi:ring-1,2-phenylacetyl-CoA epoxidase subunit PaaC
LDQHHHQRPEGHLEYVLRLADNPLLLGQRCAELVGKAPQLEEEMAFANIGLDLLGQARLLLAYAGELEGAGRAEDDLAMRRDQHEFRNCLIAELPNGDFAHQVGRLFLYSAYAELLYEALRHSADRRLAEVAAKARKETAYHVRHSGEWVVRLGDGTDESRARMAAALDRLWPYAGELLAPDALDRAMHAAGVAPDLDALRPAWDARVDAVLAEATLPRPAGTWAHKGGKTGRMHTEHLGYLLAEMQFLARAYPDARAW